MCIRDSPVLATLEDPVAFGTQAQISVAATDNSVWSVTVNRPVSNREGGQRVDIVVKLDRTSSTGTLIPLNPLANNALWQVSYEDAPAVDQLHECLPPNSAAPLPSNIRLGVGQEVRGSLCFFPVSPAVADVLSWDVTAPLIHLRLPAGDVVWATDVESTTYVTVSR